VTLAIDTIDALSQAILEVDAPAVLPVAGGTKPALSSSDRDEILRLDVSGLSGIVDYDPAELTFTAQAATPVAEVQAMLAEHEQYLPFDPPLADAGATLAGTLAAGPSGANAFRHGGIRDFVIGVRLVDGTGKLVSGGGRVVKNAAGFDLPKLMMGSIGRLGVMVALSFKVFPRPRCTTTLAVRYPGLGDALSAMSAIARGPLQAEALDIDADGRLLVRLGGAAGELESRARRCADIAGASAERLEGQDDAELWCLAARFAWMPAGSTLVRVALTAKYALQLHRALSQAEASIRFSLAANVAWVAWPPERSILELDGILRAADLAGMRLIGPPGQPLLGTRRGGAFADRLRQGLDPHHRFLDLS
jgi:glycolate oxidase FAD binding subunit